VPREELLGRTRAIVIFVELTDNFAQPMILPPTSEG
jgi:hypothetical protein